MPPLIIGVTGSIASGKSLVCQTLVELGAEHCDADKLVHRLYDPGTPGFERVVAAFGEEVIGADGYIDRRVLGAKVFGKPEEMAKLTQAIGNISEAIKGVIDDWRGTLDDEATAVIEAVNFIEPGYASWVDQTWLVVCDEDVARARLIARNNFTLEEAEQRLRSQRPWGERAPAADFVIPNNGSVEEVQETVRREFFRLWELRRKGAMPESRYHAWRRDRLEAMRGRTRGRGEREQA